MSDHQAPMKEFRAGTIVAAIWSETATTNGRSLTTLAECIEYRLPPLALDFRNAERLRNRLGEFVGLRIRMSGQGLGEPFENRK